MRLLCFAGGESPAVEGVPETLVDPAPWSRVAGNLGHPDPRLPLQVRAFLDSRMTRAVRAAVEQWRPHVVHATLLRMAPYLELRGDAHGHLDLVDSMRLNMANRAAASGPASRLVFGLEARLAGRYEALSAAAADSASVVAEADRAAPGLGPVSVVPNGVDAEALVFAEPLERAPLTIFFGNLGYFPNIEPARLLAEEVLPLLRGREPRAGLLLAGARPAAAVSALASRDGVELVANPEQMLPMLHRAAVAAVPMYSGSGMKNKVLEAFCAGVPVVTNARGIEGIDGAEPGRHFLLAESPAEIAAAIASLLDDPQRRLRIAEAARELAVARYSWERRAEQLLELYATGGASS